MDLESFARWFAYSRARDMMLEATDTKDEPWHIVHSDDKGRARLNCIAHLLGLIPYKEVSRDKAKLPKRSTKGAYDDQAVLKGRTFVPEKYVSVGWSPFLAIGSVAVSWRPSSRLRRRASLPPDRPASCVRPGQAVDSSGVCPAATEPAGTDMSEATGEFTALLARARGGDQGALSDLLRQYETKVRLVARVLMGPALRPYLDSLDLVQSVHGSLLLGLREEKLDISTPDHLIALALTLVRRKVARKWRHLQRQQRLNRGTTEAGSIADVLTSLSCPQDGPAQAAQFKDQVEHLSANLNESERRLIELRLQGNSLAEVANDLGLTAVALRVRLTRLRQRLRAAGILDEWL
jgi:RNA polymerase sigma factor (sigma-70 family)